MATSAPVSAITEREELARWLHLRFGRNQTLDWDRLSERLRSAWLDLADDAPLAASLRRSELLEEAATRSRDLIGNQRGDITGAALDAWVVLSDALRAVSDPQRRNGE